MYYPVTFDLLLLRHRFRTFLERVQFGRSFRFDAFDRLGRLAMHCDVQLDSSAIFDAIPGVCCFMTIEWRELYVKYQTVSYPEGFQDVALWVHCIFQNDEAMPATASAIHIYIII